MFPEGVSEDILDEPSPLEKVLQDEEPVEAQASEEAPE